jgi:tyrosyl-tRNA synthetase
MLHFLYSMNKEIEELISRGVEDVIEKDSLTGKLLSGKKYRIKFGIDPTGKNIHIGRATVLWKLKKFQDLGHTVVLVIGDFTARIGDPSDKLEKRPELSKEDIDQNLKDYKNQLGKIIDIDKAEFHYNSNWLANLNFEEVSNLAESFSVQQMLSRRNFKDRYENGNEISLKEFLYPLMQGYDSVAIKADIEIGGFDQLFNLKAGRAVQKYYNLPVQDILTCEMLEGTDGRKMSTSWGNVININDDPNDMFGKIMAIKDHLILKYFKLATNVSLDQIEKYKNDLDSGINPKIIKVELAKSIIALYYGNEKAHQAEQNFSNTFEKGGVPEHIQEVSYKKETSIVEILIKEGFVSSKTEWRRLVKEGAVKRYLDKKENTVNDDNVFLDEPSVYKIGKRRFIKIISI